APRRSEAKRSERTQSRERSESRTASATHWLFARPTRAPIGSPSEHLAHEAPAPCGGPHRLVRAQDLLTERCSRRSSGRDKRPAFDEPFVALGSGRVRRNFHSPNNRAALDACFTGFEH